MSVLALMMVRDEADMIETTVRHLLTQVDGIWIFDNGSTDGTFELLHGMVAAYGEERIWLRRDEEPAYWQSRKMTAWAREAANYGDGWIVPVDADEIWYCPAGIRVADYLMSQAPDVQLVQATLWNQCPSTADNRRILDPTMRIEHRLPLPGTLPKVAARANPTLEIEAGNHGARYFDGVPVVTIPGLEIRHFSWRSPEQYLRKIRNGCEAYRLTNLHSSVGAHWRMFDRATDEQILDHFRTWFVKPPEQLVLDPAPVAR